MTVRYESEWVSDNRRNMQNDPTYGLTPATLGLEVEFPTFGSIMFP
jgi:hypothetical protein